MMTQPFTDFVMISVKKNILLHFHFVWPTAISFMKTLAFLSIFKNISQQINNFIWSCSAHHMYALNIFTLIKI